MSRVTMNRVSIGPENLWRLSQGSVFADISPRGRVMGLGIERRGGTCCCRKGINVLYASANLLDRALETLAETRKGSHHDPAGAARLLTREDVAIGGAYFRPEIREDAGAVPISPALELETHEWEAYGSGDGLSLTSPLCAATKFQTVQHINMGRKGEGILQITGKATNMADETRSIAPYYSVCLRPEISVAIGPLCRLPERKEEITWSYEQGGSWLFNFMNANPGFSMSFSFSGNKGSMRNWLCLQTDSGILEIAFEMSMPNPSGEYLHGGPGRVLRHKDYIELRAYGPVEELSPQQSTRELDVCLKIS